MTAIIPSVSLNVTTKAWSTIFFLSFFSFSNSIVLSGFESTSSLPAQPTLHSHILCVAWREQNYLTSEARFPNRVAVRLLRSSLLLEKCRTSIPTSRLLRSRSITTRFRILWIPLLYQIQFLCMLHRLVGRSLVDIFPWSVYLIEVKGILDENLIEWTKLA